MKFTQPLDNKSFATTAILLPVITFPMHGWNRISHNVVGFSTMEEKRIALLIFSITLLLGYSVQLVLSLFTKEANSDRGATSILSNTLNKHGKIKAYRNQGLLKGTRFMSL